MTSERPGRPDQTSPAGAFELREGSVEDAEAIEAVHYASREAVYDGRTADWPPTGPDRAGRVVRWKRWLAAPDIACFVAVDGERIVGFVTVRPATDADAGPKVAEMPTLYVDPRWFRRGVGRALCDASIAWAAERRFEELTLWVLEMNRGARGFYETFGFVEDGARQIDEATQERLVAHRYRIGIPPTAS